jgi:hypothetical protein
MGEYGRAPILPSFQNAISTLFDGPGPSDSWLVDILKGILKDREFTSSDAIEDAMSKVGREVTLDDLQSIFRDWTSRPAPFSCLLGAEIAGAGTFFALISARFSDGGLPRRSAIDPNNSCFNSACQRHVRRPP